MNKNFLKRRIDELEESGTGGGEGGVYPNESTLLKFSEEAGELSWDDVEITSTLHAHTNKTLLDNLGETDGELTYNGVVVNTVIEDTDTFEALTDTPNEYTGEAGKIVSVKSTEDGLEFITPPSGGGDVTFVELTDTPSTLGTDGQILRMESDMFGQVSMEWQSFPSIPQNLNDFSEWPDRNTASDGQVLTLVANMSGGNDLEWQTPSSSGGGDVTHGEFTPSLETTPDGGYIVQRGHWIRIGDWVRVTVDLAWTHTTQGDGIRIDLPFDVYNSSYSQRSAGTVSPNARTLPSRNVVPEDIEAVYCFANPSSSDIWIVDRRRRLMDMSNADDSAVGVLATVEYIIDTE